MTGLRTRPVVVGVEDSPTARVAVDWAAGLAGRRAAPLRLVHVVAPGAATDAGPWLAASRARALARGAPEVDAVTVTGPVADVLAAQDAGLLVLGSAGDVPGGPAVLAGDVALRAIDRAACPVALVRGPAFRMPPPRGGPVVVGVDGSPAGRAALAVAAGLAADLDARLVAVHAWSDVVADPDGTVRRRTEPEPELVAAACARLAAEVAAVDPAVPPVQEVVRDTPLRALFDRARTARVVVTGHRAGPPRRGMLLGSTSAALVEFAPCPVVVAGPGTVAPEPAPRRPAVPAPDRS